MKRLQLFAAMAMAIDGVEFAEGEFIAEIHTNVPLGCLESLLRTSRVRVDDAGELVDGMQMNLPAGVDVTAPDPSKSEGPAGQKAKRKAKAKTTEKPGDTLAAETELATLSWPDEVLAALTGAGLQTVAQVREHVEAFEGLGDVEGLSEEQAAEVVRLVSLPE